MKLKFINPATLDKNLKATAHKSGKLGFTTEAATKMDLSVGKSAAIAINEEDPTDKNLYMVVFEDERDDAYKICKAGLYYYINTKALFDSLKIDYLKDSVVYDISSESIDNQPVYKFRRRERPKKTLGPISDES